MAKTRLVIGVLLMMTFLVGCDPRRAPVIRSLIEASDRELSEQARIAIERDPVLKELDRVCTQIALPEDFVLTRMGDLDDRSIQISYYYSSKTPYSNTRPMWKEYFLKNGWKHLKEEDTFPHQELRFYNDEYEVTTFYGGMGERSQYSINCRKK